MERVHQYKLDFAHRIKYSTKCLCCFNTKRTNSIFSNCSLLATGDSFETLKAKFRVLVFTGRSGTVLLLSQELCTASQISPTRLLQHLVLAYSTVNAINNILETRSVIWDTLQLRLCLNLQQVTGWKQSKNMLTDGKFQNGDLDGQHIMITSPVYSGAVYYCHQYYTQLACQCWKASESHCWLLRR